MASSELLVGLSLVTSLCACAPLIPSVAPLCGSWETSDASMRERWVYEGRRLRGSGSQTSSSGESSTEQLSLVPGRKGHVYIAEPGSQPPTMFSPIAPADARHQVDAPAEATRWSWANYDHDFPQEIHYTLVGETLEATIAGWSEDGGHVVGWTFTRAQTCEQTRL